MVRRAGFPPTRTGALYTYETNLTILESSAFVNNSASGFGGRRSLEMVDRRDQRGPSTTHRLFSISSPMAT